MKPYIYITRKLPEEVLKPLQDQYEVDMWEDENISVPRDVLLKKAQKASGILSMLSDTIDKELFEQSPNLKVVANLAVGYDNIDLAAANEKGAAVCNTPDVLTDTTADLTFGLMMAAARRLIEADRYVREGKWKSWSPLLMAGMDIHHKTVGIIGMGSIGEAFAKRAKGFDMDILYHNRSRKPEAEETLGAKYADLDELLSQSDFVVCLAPLTPETKGLLQREQFQKMKSSAVFVNAARGPIVNEDALYDALVNGDIAAAGLDVFEKEPINENHPLLSLKNVVALPHIGSSSVETRMEMMELCVSNIRAVLEGDMPKTLVNKEWQK
ncbi:2-hydroxyacid dehydrogenase [Rossellomorea aquimaris]|uniref:D-glycerate dehydrogenase n=1 Tax=Rossellomorea aquimaris TaxID=189382 RepID=A0A5D4TJP9_9BACI|nr:D-glycerate dehydrogenase [Rossellomorea aquimaris]TYS76010.1 D-glycerate dehydrogenase [Rossellomorea aquimaris]